MANYLSLCIGMTLLLSANHIHQVLESKMSTLALTFYGWGQSWIFLWILLPLHTIWSNIMMVPPNQAQWLTCHLSYLNHLLMPFIPPTFFQLFSNWTPNLSNTMASTTRSVLCNHPKASITSAISNMSIRNTKTGVFLYLTFPQTGMNSVLRDFYSQVMWHLPLLALPHQPSHLIPWQTLSALLILLVIALAHFLQHWLTTIPIMKCGFRATMRKNVVLNP